MRHEISDPLQHTLWFEDECGKSYPGQIHTRSELRNYAQEDVLREDLLAHGNKMKKDVRIPYSHLQVARHFRCLPPFWSSLENDQCTLKIAPLSAFIRVDQE